MFDQCVSSFGPHGVTDGADPAVPPSTLKEYDALLSNLELSNSGLPSGYSASNDTWTKDYTVVSAVAGFIGLRLHLDTDQTNEMISSIPVIQTCRHNTSPGLMDSFITSLFSRRPRTTIDDPSELVTLINSELPGLLDLMVDPPRGFPWKDHHALMSNLLLRRRVFVSFSEHIYACQDVVSFIRTGRPARRFKEFSGTQRPQVSSNFDPASVVDPPYPDTDAIGIQWSYEPYEWVYPSTQDRHQMFGLRSGMLKTNFSYDPSRSYWLLKTNYLDSHDLPFVMMTPDPPGGSSEMAILGDSVTMVLTGTSPFAREMGMPSRNAYEEFIRIVASFALCLHISPKYSSQRITKVRFSDPQQNLVYTSIADELGVPPRTVRW